jgi:hypothetical protein
MNVSRRQLTAIILLSVFSSLLVLYPLTQAVPKPSPNLGLDDLPSTSSYVIKSDGLGTYWMTDSTGHETYWSDNKTQVDQFAAGNLTSGGKIYSMDLSWDTTVTIPADVMVEEFYAGILTYRTATSTQHIPDCPTNVTSSFTLTSDTTEHTIFTITPTSSERLDSLTFDFSALTQNCTVRVYVTIGGSFVELTGMDVTVAAGSKGVPWHPYYDFNTPLKVTIQSAVAEGVSRTVNYVYWVDVF